MSTPPYIVEQGDTGEEVADGLNSMFAEIYTALDTFPIPLKDDWIQTRANETVFIPDNNIGGEIITLRSNPITPQKAGNWIELRYEIMGEGDDHNLIYKVYKNTGAGDVILADSSNGPNDRNHGIRNHGPFETNYNSTPNSETFSIIDKSVTAVPTTYKVFLVVSDAGTGTFELNESVSGIQEHGISQLQIYEHVI